MDSKVNYHTRWCLMSVNDKLKQLNEWLDAEITLDELPEYVAKWLVRCSAILNYRYFYRKKLWEGVPLHSIRMECSSLVESAMIVKDEE